MGDVTLSIAIDSSATKTGAAAVRAELEALKAAAAGMNTSFQASSSASAAAGAAFKNMGAATAAASSAAWQATGAHKSLAETLADYDRSVSNAARAQAEMSSSLRGMKSAANEAADGMHANSGQLREFIVLAPEMVQGNFNRIPGSMMVLAERSGELEKIFEAITSTTGLVIEGIVGLGAAAAALFNYFNELDWEAMHLNATLAMFGQGGGKSMQSLKLEIQATSIALGLSREETEGLMEAFGTLGGVTEAQRSRFMELANAASKATGRDLKQTYTELANAIQGGAQGIQSYLEKYNLLDKADYQYLSNLQANANMTESFDFAIGKLTSRFGEYVDMLKKVNAESKTLYDDVSLGESALAGLPIPPSHAAQDAAMSNKGSDAKNSKFEHEAQEAARQQINIHADTIARISEMDAEAAIHKLQSEQQINETSKAAELRQEKDFLQKKYQAERDALVDKATATGTPDLERQGYERQIENLDHQHKLDLIRQEQDAEVAAHNEEKQAAEEAEKEAEQAQREQIALAKDKLSFTTQMATAEIQNQRSVLEAQNNNSEQSYQAKSALLLKEYQLEVDAANKEAALEGMSALQTQQLYEKTLLLKQKYLNDQANLDRAAAQQSMKDWQSIVEPIGSSWQGMLNGMMQGTETLQQVEQKALKNIVTSYASAIAEMIARFLAFEALTAAGWKKMAAAVNPATMGGMGGALANGLGIGGGAAASAGGAAVSNAAQNASTQAMKTLTTAMTASTAAAHLNTTSTGANTTSTTANTTTTGVNTSSTTANTAGTTSNTTAHGISAASLDVNSVSTDANTTTTDMNSETLVEQIADWIASLFTSDTEEAGEISDLAANTIALQELTIAVATSAMTPFATGAWEIPHDMPAYIHAGEMIIPASAAEKVRQTGILGDAAGSGQWTIPGSLKQTAISNSNFTPMADTGTGGGSSRPQPVSIVINAVDPASFQNYLQRSGNSAAVVKAVTSQIRNGAKLPTR